MKEYTMRDSLPVTQFESYMKGWAKKKPGFVTINAIGKSGEYDIFRAVFTDPSVPDDDKQVVLITAQHSIELSGVTSVLSVGNYLVSGKEDANEMLRHLIVVMIPLSNPYSYAKQSPAYQFRNEAGICEYFAFNYTGIKYDKKTAPAAHAVKETIDLYKPELMMDIHGVYYQNQLVVESMNISGNPNNRFYNNELIRAGQRAGTEAGFSMMNFDAFEVLLQTDRDCKDPEINTMFYPMSDNLAQAQTYAYLKYHTMGGTFETAWEGSAVARILECLRMGCRVWAGEEAVGYPTRTFVSPFGHISLRVYGKTAKERRESRAELWPKRSKVRVGIGHPEMPGLCCALVATDSAIADEVVKRYELMPETIKRMKERFDVNEENMLAMLDRHYPLHMEYYPRYEAKTDNREAPIRHGITIRMALPFADARNFTVLYNGYEQKVDLLDGYTVIKAENWTYVDLHLPADKIAPFGIAMVEYDCTVPKLGIMEF